MQEFLENGNLNPGIHNYTFDIFEKQFIKSFPTSDTRLEIYKNFWV